MNKRGFLLSFFFSLLIFSSKLYSQSIEIINPSAVSKWCGVQKIEWSTTNKGFEFLFPEPGYYKIFYAPSGTPIPNPNPEPTIPWVQLNGIIDDDGETNSNYSIEWNTENLQGNYTILIRAYYYNHEYIANKVSDAFLIDNTPPNIMVSITPLTPDGENGWYRTEPTIKIIASDNAGIKEVQHKTDKETLWNIISCEGAPAVKEIEFTAPEGKTLYVKAFDCAEDIYGQNNEASEEFNNCKVDITPPSITININYGEKRFSVDVLDEISGVASDKTRYSFNGTDWFSYLDETLIPEGTKKLLIEAFDNAGNRAEATKTFASDRVISGYIKDYKGSALKEISVLLSGDTNKKTLTNPDGYYEFTELNPFGYYFVVPALKNNIPSALIYNGLEEDKTDQNFVLSGGWLKGGYDRGNTRDYISSSIPVIDPLVITERYTIGTTGKDVLTGIFNSADNKMDIVFTDGESLRSYYFTENRYTRKGWSPEGTFYNLSLLDNLQISTSLDSIVLCGAGSEYIAEIRDSEGIQVKEITADVLSDTPAADTTWSSVSIGGGDIIFAGAGTDYNKIFRYNVLTDTTVWEATLPQTIVPGTEVLCLRDTGLLYLIGSMSDIESLELTAIDISTGASLWTHAFDGLKGAITPFAAPLEDGGWDDVIAVRTSTTSSQGGMQVYVLDGATGENRMNWQDRWEALSTAYINREFSAAISDVDNNGVTDLVISDGAGNIYIINLLYRTLLTSSVSAGRVWAVVDFDGRADGKKEIIVSSGTTIKVLSSDLTTLASRDMAEDIQNIVLGQIESEERIDIIASLKTKTSIVKAGIITDLPAQPIIMGIELYFDNVYLTWEYASTSADLSGFKIYRSSDGGINWKLVGTKTADAFLHIDSPSGGLYSYKVAAYNDYGARESSAVMIEVMGGDEPSSSISSCFIATAAYGTPMAEEVVRLRSFKDSRLLTHRAGRAFVRWYYRHSPPVAEYIRDRRWARAMVRTGLRPLLWVISYIK